MGVIDVSVLNLSGRYFHFQAGSAVSWKLMFTKLTGEARTISSRLEILGGIQLEGLCLSHPRVLRSAATDLTGWLNDVDRSAVAFY